MPDSTVVGHDDSVVFRKTHRRVISSLSETVPRSLARGALDIEYVPFRAYFLQLRFKDGSIARYGDVGANDETSSVVRRVRLKRNV
jgi:hypothetical protein